MTKNLDVSDSNNILKSIITILIVAGIAYLIYYLYNQYNEQKNHSTHMQHRRDPGQMHHAQHREDSQYAEHAEHGHHAQHAGHAQQAQHAGHAQHAAHRQHAGHAQHAVHEEGISSLHHQITGSPNGQKNPIMNKTNYLPKGKIVGGEDIEHFSADPNYKKERNVTSFPKDQLTAEELLPQDNSSLWAQVNPSGEGSLKDRNFLQSGYHIGINTVGQTLRNANLQLRSEPPCPQVKVSPWLQSSIEPDVSRKPFEIGGCA